MFDDVADGKYATGYPSKIPAIAMLIAGVSTIWMTTLLLVFSVKSNRRISSRVCTISCGGSESSSTYQPLTTEKIDQLYLEWLTI